MILFFLIVSVGNLALGYFIALKYHNVLFQEPVRERELVRSRANSGSSAPTITIDASQMPFVTKEVPPGSKPVEAKQEPAEVESPEAKSQQGETPEPEPSDNLSEQAESDTQAEEAPESEAPETHEMAASLEDFMGGLTEFRSQLSSLDQRVRKCVKAPNSREIEDCIKEFRIANSLYLEQSSETAELLQQPSQSETENQSEAREAFQQALSTQAEEVRKAEGELELIDLEADSEAGCETLLRNANSLHASNDKLREEIYTVQREFSPEPESDTEDQNTDLLIDELTQIPSRYQLEVALRQQVKSGGPYCVGLIDVDHCGDLNLMHGQQMTDGVIKALAKIVADSAQAEVCAARYSGQQFAILFAGQKPGEAALLAEKLRQVVEKTNFQCEGTSLEITISMVLVSGNESDTLTTIEQRLRTAVSAGKSFGKNRTFRFQDGEVEPILPPDLEIEQSICEVTL